MCWKRPKATSSSRRHVHRQGHRQEDVFRRLALAAYVAHKFPTSEIEPGLKEGAFHDPTNFTFPAGCHICEVEIDPETGDDRDRRLGGGR
jgi:CO/xanthine dehydrogenase Mo-binding subunit